MSQRKPIVVRIGSKAYRRSPERLLLEREESESRIEAIRTERDCPIEAGLRAAVVAHAEKYGWPTTRGALAAMAHEKPAKAAGSRRKAEALFRRSAA